jgi:pyruvate/2-oxoglutarate dehydrogenase complex dihydrolipoamide dehydrogenase (E3) component
MTTKPYEIIVIGGGSAGIVSANVAAALEVRTALVEKERIGGECLWTGCVPSKALIHAASVAAIRAGRRALEARGAAPGAPCPVPGEDSPAIDGTGDRALSTGHPAPSLGREALTYVRDSIERVKEADATEAMMRDFGVELFFGPPRFINRHVLQVGDQQLLGRQFILATGSHPAIPEIPGLAEAGFLTNQTIFSLDDIPASLAVIGGGPIGVEMAQAFHRLGAEITLLQRGPHLLPRDDAELTTQLEELLRAEGIRILTDAAVTEVQRAERGQKRLAVRHGDQTLTIEAVEILVAAGRRPNVAGLNLGTAGVRVGENGVWVDDRLRTSARHIWACGDVLGRHQFSHMAEHEAKVVVRTHCCRSRRGCRST